MFTRNAAGLFDYIFTDSYHADRQPRQPDADVDPEEVGIIADP